ncbi:hypothetical protein F6X51_12570 [Methylobacterium planeticum]|uniref:ABC transporter ATPase n=2 Tax=Methylobacterium planeticum TaxID=2615211 RepID=A0A6N6MSN3_9HYPH|nr:hypothetical protein F6X51_12570 [Methylobacterium planeticum]
MTPPRSPKNAHPLVAGLALAAIGAACLGSARADGCDALTARVIRATGASLAGRSGALAVFRAADAERMSLDCRDPRMVFAAREREPRAPFFTLIGLAAQGLAGARAREAEVLALRLHQDSLLTSAPREGRAGRAALRCETGPRGDALSGDLTVCVLRRARPAALRRRAGLAPPEHPAAGLSRAGAAG